LRRAAAAAIVAAAVSACGVSDASSPPVQHRLVFIHGLGTAKQSLWIANADGTRMRRLIAPAAHGVVSPDGRLVAVERRAWTELWTVRTDTSDPHRVARNVFALGWLRDNRRVVGVKRGLLVTVDASTGAVKPLARVDAIAGWDLSPNGDVLVYGRRVPNRLGARCAPHTDLFLVGVDGGRPRRLTHDERSSYPVWGSRGIAFEREVPTCRQASGIWRIRSDGSGLAPIAPRALRRYSGYGYYGYRPYAWLPGERLLIGLRNEWGDDAAILDGRRVTELHQQIDEPSHDGRFFVGAQGGAEFPFTIAIVRVGGAAKTIARGRVCCPNWNR
jgi:hypothetical protein